MVMIRGRDELYEWLSLGEEWGWVQLASDLDSFGRDRVLCGTQGSNKTSEVNDLRFSETSKI